MMIVNEKGKYKLLKSIKTSNNFSVATLPKGTTVNITQIDKKTHKVIGNLFMDWIYWDLPVEKI